MIVKEIGIIFVFAGILGILMKLLKQPTIIAYVLAGVIVGPLALGWAGHEKTVAELSEFAVVVMLFVIGIEMDLTRLKNVGMVAILGGAIQVGLTFLLGFGISKCFGYTNITASYLGFALAFSSTMLVVKILGEKYDLVTLYGRISIGMLVMQDIFAIFALSILGSTGGETSMLTTATQAAGLILVIVLVGGYFVFPKVFDYVAKDRETLFLVAMSILFLMAFYAEDQKLSLGIGSFLAGLSISKLSYRHEVIGDLKALKSFFTILFFAVLGLQLAPSTFVEGHNQGTTSISAEFLSEMSHNAGMILSFAFAAIVLKPILVMIIVKMFGYGKTPAINTGLAMGQFSEFSLVLIAQGIVTGHVDKSLLSPVIIVTIVSMVLSSYSMLANLSINRLLSKYTTWLDKLSIAKPKFDTPQEIKEQYSVLLVGMDKLGHVIANALRKKGIKFLAVDSNPDVIPKMAKSNTPFLFGDVTTHQVLEELDFKTIGTVFSTIPDLNDALLLIEYIKKVNPGVNFIGIVDSRSKAEALYKLGAHYVLVTYMLAGTQLVHGQLADEDSITLDTLINDIEGVRVRGKKHRTTLFHEEVHGGGADHHEPLIEKITSAD